MGQGSVTGNQDYTSVFAIGTAASEDREVFAGMPEMTSVHGTSQVSRWSDSLLGNPAAPKRQRAAELGHIQHCNTKAGGFLLSSKVEREVPRSRVVIVRS